MDLRNLLNKKSGFSKNELVFLLGLEEEEDINKLISHANEIRNKHFGQEVILQGIISFSNNCSQNCLFCGLREENLILPRYRMTGEEILDSAKLIYSKGLRTIILQSGEDNFYDTDLISYLIYSIKRQFDVAITLNLGQRTFDEYKTWKIAGADNYLLKYETANPKLFSIYQGKAKLEERINHLRYLKNIGYNVGTGSIIGLPHQTNEDIADDILLCKELNIDLAAFGPFIPAVNTPYQNYQPGNLTLTLKTLAISRLVLENVEILSASALDTLDCKGSEKGLLAGANLVMPNYTPTPYRKNYRVFDNKTEIDDDPLSSHKLIRTRIEAIGKRISDSNDNSLNSYQN